MRYGPVASRKIPDQDSAKVMLMAERFQRASYAHQRWAEQAKKCTDFFEGRQWTAEALAEMRAQKRPALTFNIIAPLVRLILGYQRNNKTDIVYQPSNDARSTENTAEVLTAIEKTIASMTDQEFVDTEVFLDGIVTARGYYRTLLEFDDNDLGESVTRAQDPFMTYLDPDGNTYDLNDSCGFVQTSRFVSIDWIEDQYGKNISELLRPYTQGQTPVGPVSSLMVNNEVTPIRYFGEREDVHYEWWDNFYTLMGDFVDTHRKTLRIVETEHKVRERRKVIIDLETGDKKVLPENWDQERIAKILAYAEHVGNPLIVEDRMVERYHWTTMCGDILLYDRPSPYQTYSITPFFPYFRRGFTRGVVDDMIDPQMEKNKRRSVETEMVSKLSNGGWRYHANSMTAQQKRNLKRFGAAPGFQLEWQGEPHMKPERIEPGAPPMAHERLENKADEDIRRISGINESALGELDRVQSGRAIEARQRQAVIAIQLYMDNFKRSKKLLGGKRLEIIQNHYTEPRLYRTIGEDGKLALTMINQQQIDPHTGIKRILNDITLGRYVATVDETPLSATFANAQFEEMLTLIEKMGPAVAPYMPLFADLMVDMSSLPRKQEWIERLGMIAQAQGGGAPGAGGEMGGAPGTAPGNAPGLDQGMAPGGGVVPVA